MVLDITEGIKNIGEERAKIAKAIGRWNIYVGADEKSAREKTITPRWSSIYQSSPFSREETSRSVIHDDSLLPVAPGGCLEKSFRGGCNDRCPWF